MYRHNLKVFEISEHVELQIQTTRAFRRTSVGSVLIMTPKEKNVRGHRCMPMQTQDTASCSSIEYIKDSEQGFLVQTAQPTAGVSPRSYPAQPGGARCSPLASRYSSGAICFLGIMKNRYSMMWGWGQGGKESSISLSVWKDKQE